MNVKSIYIVISQTGTWLSTLIKLYTKQKINHVSISLENSLSDMYSFGRINPSNPFSGGFAQESIYDGVYKMFPNCRCAIYRITVTDEQYNKVKEIIEEFKRKRHHYRYNFLGLFYIVLHMDKPRKRHYFCSQFVSEVLTRSGIAKFDKPFHLVTTKDFLKLPNLQPVFEGLSRYVASPVIY